MLKFSVTITCPFVLPSVVPVDDRVKKKIEAYQFILPTNIYFCCQLYLGTNLDTGNSIKIKQHTENFSLWIL